MRAFVAEVLADNIAMLKVFERSGLATTESRNGTVIDVTMRLTPETAPQVRGGT